MDWWPRFAHFVVGSMLILLGFSGRTNGNFLSGQTVTCQTSCWLLVRRLQVLCCPWLLFGQINLANQLCGGAQCGLPLSIQQAHGNVDAIVGDQLLVTFAQGLVNPGAIQCSTVRIQSENFWCRFTQSIDEGKVTKMLQCFSGDLGLQHTRNPCPPT